MSTRNETTAYGDRVADLRPGLIAFWDGMAVGTDGMCRSAVTLEPQVGLPLARALMRVEAELLREDADAIGQEHFDARTEGQRGADAFIRLIQSIGKLEARSEGFEPPTF